MAAQLLSRGLDFAFAVFMLRYLGPTDAGKFAFAVLVIGFFLLFTDYGLGTLLTREVARDRQDAERYFANTVVLRILLLLAAVPALMAVVGIYGAFFELTPDTGWTIIVLFIAILPSTIAASLSSLYSAFERMEIPAAVGIVTNVVRVAISVLFLLAGFGIVGLAIVSIIANVVTVVIFYFLVLRSHFRPRLGFDWAFQRSMLRTSAPLMFNNFLSTVFFRFDVLILRAVAGDRSVGYYTTAYKFIDGMNIIPSLFTLALFPVMSRLAMDDRSRLLYAYRLSLKLLILTSLPLAAGVTIVAPQLVLTFFGEAFAPSILALQILIWFLPFSFINSLTHYVLIAANQQHYLTRAFVIGATFNIAANLVAIPMFGFLGAAVVTILSEIVLLIPFLIGIREHVGQVSILRLSLRPVIAAVVMSAVLWLLQDWHFLLLTGVGLIVYPGMLVLLRTFDRDDATLLRSLVQRGQQPVPA